MLVNKIKSLKVRKKFAVMREYNCLRAQGFNNVSRIQSLESERV